MRSDWFGRKERLEVGKEGKEGNEKLWFVAIVSSIPKMAYSVTN